MPELVLFFCANPLSEAIRLRGQYLKCGADLAIELGSFGAVYVALPKWAIVQSGAREAIILPMFRCPAVAALN